MGIIGRMDPPSAPVSGQDGDAIKAQDKAEKSLLAFPLSQKK
jgi:hypothetical protein